MPKVAEGIVLGRRYAIFANGKYYNLMGELIGESFTPATAADIMRIISEVIKSGNPKDLRLLRTRIDTANLLAYYEDGSDAKVGLVRYDPALITLDSVIRNEHRARDKYKKLEDYKTTEEYKGLSREYKRLQVREFLKDDLKDKSTQEQFWSALAEDDSGLLGEFISDIERSGSSVNTSIDISNDQKYPYMRTLGISNRNNVVSIIGHRNFSSNALLIGLGEGVPYQSQEPLERRVRRF